MSESFIKYDGRKGFWIEEVFMQLLFHYINNELIKPQYSFINKDNILFNSQFHLDGYSRGILSLGWTNEIENNEVNTMISVLQNVKIMLQNKGSFIPVNELQAIPTEDEDFKRFYRHPFPTSELIKIVNALIQMLQGTWTSTNYSMDINY